MTLGGVRVTGGGGGASTLQEAYDNGDGDVQDILLDAALGRVRIRDADGGIGGNLFEVTHFSGGTLYFQVAANRTMITPVIFGSSGLSEGVVVLPIVNQGGTASYAALRVNVAEVAIGSGANRLLDLAIGGTSQFAVSREGKITLINTTDVDGGADVAGEVQSRDFSNLAAGDKVLVAA